MGKNALIQSPNRRKILPHSLSSINVYPLLRKHNILQKITVSENMGYNLQQHSLLIIMDT